MSQRSHSVADPPHAFWKTLRFRLSVWNAGVVILTALLTLLGLRQGVQWALLREVDQVLVEDAQEIALALADADAPDFEQLKAELLRKGIGHKQRGWYVKLCEAGAHEDGLIWATPEAPGPIPYKQSSPPGAPWSHGDYRIVRQTIPRTVQKIDVIRVGTSLVHVRSDIARIDQWVLLSAGAVLITAPACGYWLAARR